MRYRDVRLPALVLVLITPIVTGCQPDPDFSALSEEILALHRAGIQAHLDQDVDFFTRDISEDYFSVGGGEIRHPTREEIEANFSSYLKATNFTKYEDLQEPLIGFSRDGSLAWCIVKVKIEGTRAMADTLLSELDFTCAWITLYQRQGDRWLRLGEVSSFK